ncbi:hypothetical protein BDW66DRAFT_62776 [Aspergillus desertorum]
MLRRFYSGVGVENASDLFAGPYRVYSQNFMGRYARQSKKNSSCILSSHMLTSLCLMSLEITYRLAYPRGPNGLNPRRVSGEWRHLKHQAKSTSSNIYPYREGKRKKRKLYVWNAFLLLSCIIWETMTYVRLELDFTVRICWLSLFERYSTCMHLKE